MGHDQSGRVFLTAVTFKRTSGGTADCRENLNNSDIFDCDFLVRPFRGKSRFDFDVMTEKRP